MSTSNGRSRSRDLYPPVSAEPALSPDRAAPERPESSGSQGHAERSTIDWALAASTAARLVGNGPSLPRAQANRLITELAQGSARAESHVRELTGLGGGLPLLEGTVVDRRGWVASAAAGLERLTSSAQQAGAGQSPDGTEPEQPRSRRSLLSRGAGVQTGMALAFLGSKVLGQYDPFGGDGNGTLLLVAPNVLQAEEAMGVSSTDFRMWVCLHESTHRLQFTAVPWLREYFVTEVGRFLGSGGETKRSLAELPELIRQSRGNRKDGALGVVRALQSPEQQQAFDRLISLATVLEGHADYVMDAVGPEVVPSVASIRRKFNERRKGGGLLDRLLRSLLGIDAKIKQYEQGSAFVKQVVAEVGMEGFNQIWHAPENLPTRPEITDPAAWLARVRP